MSKELKRYSLEIYLPDNKGSDIACLIEADEPFLSIHIGDIINPRTWTHHYLSTLQEHYKSFKIGTLLRVTGIEHFIIQRNEGYSQHKLGIFTEAIKDNEESRP